MRVEVRSRQTVNHRNGRSDDETVAVISIADPDDNHPEILISELGLQGTLRLSFHDLDREDLPKKYKLMSDEDGRQVAEFVERHKDVDLLIVQCDAGISRSSGMAAAILKHQTGDDSQIFGNRRFIPNRWVNKKTREALADIKRKEEEAS